MKQLCWQNRYFLLTFVTFVFIFGEREITILARVLTQTEVP